MEIIDVTLTIENIRILILCDHSEQNYYFMHNKILYDIRACVCT